MHMTFYVDPLWNRKAIHTPLLFPFWGNPNPESSLFAREMFDAYAFDTSLYTVTNDIKNADMVLAPYRHQWFLRHDTALLEECVRTAHAAGVPILIDGVGDIEYPIDIPNAYILRIGGYRFLHEKNRIQIPPASDDLLERCVGGQLQLRQKHDGKPIVGFAGWATLPLGQRMKTIAKEVPDRIRGAVDSRYKTKTKGVLWRKRAIGILARSPLVELNLKARSTFSGSARTAAGDMRKLRQQLVDTVLGSDYGLDVRGDANDATRLFEILSLGRIPVILDTERNFPFSDVVDYDSFSLRVDFRDIKKLPNIIADIHKNTSPERFLQMQQNARRAFVENFRIDAQMKHIIRKINNLQAKEKSSPK